MSRVWRILKWVSAIISLLVVLTHYRALISVLQSRDEAAIRAISGVDARSVYGAIGSAWQQDCAPANPFAIRPDIFTPFCHGVGGGAIGWIITLPVKAFALAVYLIMHLVAQGPATAFVGCAVVAVCALAAFAIGAESENVFAGSIAFGVGLAISPVILGAVVLAYYAGLAVVFIACELVLIVGGLPGVFAALEHFEDCKAFVHGLHEVGFVQRVLPWLSQTKPA